MVKRLLVPCIVLFLCSCAPTRFVKPLEKGRQAVDLSLGGPLFSFGGAVIPMPFLTATYGYGIDSTLTGFGSVNLTSAFYGNAQVELGVTKRILRQNGFIPGVSVTPVANIIYRNKDAKKLYPQLDVNAYWDYNKGRNFFYAGLNNWFELSGKRAHDEDQPHHWLLTPQVGNTFSRHNHNFTIELKVPAVNVYNPGGVVEYKTPFGHQGAFGIYFGYTRKF